MREEDQLILDSCLERWLKTDERTEYFCDMYSDWIKQIPDSTNSTVIYFLNKFCYYPHEVVNGCLADLHCEFMKICDATNENTIYTIIPSKSGIFNSSTDYLLDYKYTNKLNKFNCFDNISKIKEEQWPFISNIVFIDDCAGSGKTFKDYIKTQLDQLTGKKLYYIAIHVMEKANDRIEKFASENNISIDIVCHKIQGKAFSDPTFTNAPNKKVMFVETSKAFGINESDILGFRKTESLCAFYNNTPNNTLGLFRVNTDVYQSPFPRIDDEKPTWQKFSDEKRKRKEQNNELNIERNRNV